MNPTLYVPDPTSISTPSTIWPLLMPTSFILSNAIGGPLQPTRSSSGWPTAPCVALVGVVPGTHLNILYDQPFTEVAIVARSSRPLLPWNANKSPLRFLDIRRHICAFVAPTTRTCSAHTPHSYDAFSRTFFPNLSIFFPQ